MAVSNTIRLAPTSEPLDDRGRHLEENLSQAADLSQALWMLMAGVIESYPHAIEQADLTAIYQLATEVRDRAVSANKQWHADPS